MLKFVGSAVWLLLKLEVSGALLALVIVLVGSAEFPADVEGVFASDIEKVVFGDDTEFPVNGIGVR